jgi:hypothetical protein
MNNIDLNINNYTTENLFNFFGLNINDKYLETNILEDKKKNITTILLNDTKLTLHKKNEILDFTIKAYNNLLLYIKNSNNDNKNSLINNNTITDDIELNNLYSNKDIKADDYFYTTATNTNELNNHPIVKKPYTKFIYTNPNNTFDGIINPFEKRTMTKVVCLDTIFRDNFCNTLPNNFTVQLSTPLENVISMKLMSFEIPRLWHSISPILKNNTFKIYLYNMVDYPDIEHTICIPDGNYSNHLLVDCINNYFSNIGNGLDYLRFDVSVTTSKACFFVKSNPSIDTILPYDLTNAHYSPNFKYKIDFLNCEWLGLYLGFSKVEYSADKNDFYVDNFNSSPAIKYYGIIFGESSCGSNIDNYIFIDINDFNKNFNTNTIISQKQHSFIGNNIIGKIPIGLPDSLILNNTSDSTFKTRDYYGPVKIQKLHITLLNKYGKAIDLHNNNFSLSLEFNTLYS